MAVMYSASSQLQRSGWFPYPRVLMGFDVVDLVRFLLIGVALLLVFLSVITWNRREDAPGAASCAALIAGMAIYAFGYSGEVAQTTVEGAKRWLDVEHLALPWAPGLWLLTACKHNGRPVRLWLIFIIPVISFFDHYANLFNSFYTGPFTLVHRAPFWVLNIPRGPVSMLDNAYLLVAFVAGAWIYLTGLRNASSLFRKQALVLVLTSQIPIVGYFAYLAGLSPWGLDITPFLLGLSSVFFYYGFFHCGLYDLAPTARTLIFKSMRDAVLVLDTRDRLLDFNPAAQALLPMLVKNKLGAEIASLISTNQELVQALGATGERAEFTVVRDDLLQSFEIRTWPLISSTKNLGRAVIFADVTAQVLLREELRRRADTDSLTGLANRRRFHHALEAECLRISRNRTPIALLMIDLDYFKDINDCYGHPAGDAVLRGVAQVLADSIRKSDLLARYGGEEFAILMPETHREGATIIADRIRAAVFQNPVKVDEKMIHLSASIGVSCYGGDSQFPSDPDPEILLKEADLALYRAKASGRNRVDVYSPGGELPGLSRAVSPRPHGKSQPV
jgi:diguanylate cyclase (GGDEF)-like protein